MSSNITTYLGQSFEHTLTVLKGPTAPAVGVLDFAAGLSSSVNINSTGLPPQSGMCVHYQSDGFHMGASTNKMPMFLWPGYADPDVNLPGVAAGVAKGGTSGASGVIPAWIGSHPSGILTALVGKGAIEIETTEFDTTQTYAINDYLRAVTSDTNANAGKLTNQDASGGVGFATASKAVWGNPAATNWESIVGIVSRGAYTNAKRKSALALWTTYLPGTR